MRSALPIKPITWPPHLVSSHWDVHGIVIFYDPSPIYARIESRLLSHQRFQSGLTMEAMWPNPLMTQGDQTVKLCACGCGEPARRRWATTEHSRVPNMIFEIIYGRVSTIRELIGIYHGEVCADCGSEEKKLYLDHKIPVLHGGGAAWLSNYQLLCHTCHVDKTNRDFSRKEYAPRLFPELPEPTPLFPND